MEIQVEEGNWGQARVSDIYRLLADVAGQLLRHVSQPPEGRIRVQCQPNEASPRILFRSSPQDDYVIWLTASGRLWCKFTYQFAHEFCHLLSDYERLRLIPNQWFHETLCELASIFVLKQMATTWQNFPPFPEWRDYAASLDAYADEFIARNEHRLPTDASLSDWLRTNESILRADPYRRPLNGLVAVQLLPLFQATPESWQAIRFIPNLDASFADFLASWRQACPEEHQPFVSQIAQHFGINIDQ